MSVVLGIDPGLNGGLALLGDGGLMVEPMPTIGAQKGRVLDLPTLVRLLRGWQASIDMAYLEMVAARPGQGVSSTFKFGRGYGAIEGILAALVIPYQLVTPQAWCKEMLTGIEGNTAKDKSKIAASRMFPGTDFRESERSRVPHDGMVDAALIALYGQRKRKVA